MSSRRVVITAFRGFELLDVSGPVAVLSTFNRLRGSPAYSLCLASDHGKGRVVSSSGIAIDAECSLRVRGELDTLIVPGAGERPVDRYSPELVAGVRRLARRSRRIASVCTGAFVLGDAGLLHGRRVTTHWAAAELLARQYPTCEVESDSIYVQDGNVWTSAGVSSGIDLALALVNADHGAAAATDVARHLVVYVTRPGGQSQFSTSLTAQAPVDSSMRELQGWIEDHLQSDLSLPVFADRAHLSGRRVSENGCCASPIRCLTKAPHTRFRCFAPMDPES